ncbi:MAG: glycosyltransferase [Clostridia bacterium]|nr:glycosyltransferase [Clostridia bacterium]
MKKRSVLFINDSLSGGSGVFRSLAQTLQNIPYEKYDVTLFILPGGDTASPPDGALPDEVKLIKGEDGVHYYRRPTVAATHALSKVFSALKIKKAAAFFKKLSRGRVRALRSRYPAKAYFSDTVFDAAVAYTVPGCAPVLKHVKAHRKYAVFHSSQASFFPDETKDALRLFDGMIAVNDGVRQVLAETYPRFSDKIGVITNYVNAGDILKAAAAKPSPYNEDKPVICSCGRLSREKGFDLAVGAAKILKDRGLDFIWYFVGDGEDREKIEHLIRVNTLEDRIILTGYAEDPYGHIGGCDVYVQPSYEEAQPLALLEAAVLGRTVVSTETVGGKYILKGGSLGVLTPVSAAGLADGIEPLLRDAALREAKRFVYSPEDNMKDRASFAAAWDRLLSGQE